MKICADPFFCRSYSSFLLLQNPRNLPHSSSIEKCSYNPPLKWKLSEVMFLVPWIQKILEELFDVHVSRAVLLVLENGKNESQLTYVDFDSYSEKPYSSFPALFLVSPSLQDLVRDRARYQHTPQLSYSDQPLSDLHPPSSFQLLVHFLHSHLSEIVYVLSARVGL